uniref:Adenylate kinase 7a n=1 Tax=Cyclopterus lumpus TaxID=8103 RepID=A0A8C3B032_CYCLU
LFKMGDEQQQTRPKRIFINDVDRYSSKHIAKVTSASEGAVEAGDTSSARGEPAFQIVGTVSPSSKHDQQPFLLEQYPVSHSTGESELLERLLECDVVVYNISESATQQQIEEATWAITTLNDEIENFKSRKMFILVSSVMTWTMTKPQDPEETDVLLTEEEFRRKRPHPNFKNHNILEKLVLKLGRGRNSKLAGYVVASGLQYGEGENLFHYFFKVSWLMQLPKVPLFGPGTNHIPMIHVNDLAGVIQNIVEFKPKSKYILAVDDSKNTLEDIVKVTLLKTIILSTFGNLFQQEELEYLNINLRLDAFIIKDSFSLNWTSEAGMVENMASIVEEYKNTRQLLPIRICLVGPPAVGKTTIAEKLCSHYQIHHIKIKEVIEEKLTQLVTVVGVFYFLTLGFNNCVGPLGRLADHLVFNILKEKLNSKPCRNQGFVLNGFPKSYEQAKRIFSGIQDLMPKTQHVFALNATDDFLTKRAQGLPQSVAENMRYTQEEFVPRLTRYRQLSTAEETLLDYFDELEIHPEHIEVTTADSEYTDVMKKITDTVGIPKNYGLNPEEQEVENKKKEEERKQKLAGDAAQKKRRNEAALAEMQRNLSEVQRQELELQEAHSLPLRNYLMKYVMPSLTEAMLECTEIKPEDPVDFLVFAHLQL